MASFSSSASMSGKPPSQSIWRGEGNRRPKGGRRSFIIMPTGIASMDLFVVPTISFRLLYGLLILHHDRRQILWLGVTAHPTAEWISHQLTEAYESRWSHIRNKSSCAFSKLSGLKTPRNTATGIT